VTATHEALGEQADDELDAAVALGGQGNQGGAIMATRIADLRGRSVTGLTRRAAVAAPGRTLRGSYPRRLECIRPQRAGVSRGLVR